MDTTDSTTGPLRPTDGTRTRTQLAARLGTVCLTAIALTGCTFSGGLQMDGPALDTSAQKRDTDAPERSDDRSDLRVDDDRIDRLTAMFRSDANTPPAIRDALRECSESMVFDQASFDPGPRSAIIVTVYECGSLARGGPGNPGDRGPVTRVTGAFLYADHTTSEKLVFESNVAGRALLEADGDLVGLSLRGDEGVVTHYAWDGTSYVESR